MQDDIVCALCIIAIERFESVEQRIVCMLQYVCVCVCVNVLSLWDLWAAAVAVPALRKTCYIHDVIYL